MRKLALLLGSLVVVASASAKEVVPAPVVVEEAPVQIVEKEVIVYRDKEEGFRPSGNVGLEVRYFDRTEGQKNDEWSGADGDKYSRTQLSGAVQMTENQKFEFRVRDYNNLDAHQASSDMGTETRLRYSYNHGNLGDSKVNFTSWVEYKKKKSGVQHVDYQARFDFAEYLFNNDFVKTSTAIVAPRYKYAWGGNDDNYTNTLGLYVDIINQYPWGFGSEIEIDGANYNFYGEDQVTYKFDKTKNDSWNDDFTLSVKAIITQDTNLYSADKLSIDWHSEGGFDTYNWSDKDNVPYGLETVEFVNENKDEVTGHQKFEDISYQAYFSSDVTASYQATEFVNVFALAGAEYRNWAISNASSATNWRWQPYVAAGFNVAF